MGGVEQHHKGLSQPLQLADYPLLRLQVILPGNVGHGAVGGHHNPNGGVVGDHLLGAEFRRLRHGDLMVEPGGHHHPGLVAVHLPQRAGHHVAHAVDEPDGEHTAVLHAHLHRVLRDEFGFGGHHHPPGTALRQLIPGPIPDVGVLDLGQNQGLHEPLDEGGLPRPHGAYHADIDIALGALGDILIQFVFQS